MIFPRNLGMKKDTTPVRSPATNFLPLAEIVGRITDGFFATDPDGRFTYMNKKAAGIFGLDPDSGMGLPAWETVPDNAGKQCYKACQLALSSQKYQCQEVWLPADDQWLEYHIYPSPDGLSVLFQDITDRKKAEEEWKRAELRYRALIEQASDSIMITDMQGNFLDVNPALCQLFGYTKEELLKSNIASLLDPEELKTDPIQFALLATGQPVLRDRRMIHKDGTIIEVEANVKMIPDGRLLAIARNITERKKSGPADPERKRDLRIHHRQPSGSLPDTRGRRRHLALEQTARNYFWILRRRNTSAGPIPFF